MNFGSFNLKGRTLPLLDLALLFQVKKEILVTWDPLALMENQVWHMGCRA